MGLGKFFDADVSALYRFKRENIAVKKGDAD